MKMVAWILFAVFCCLAMTGTCHAIDSQNNCSDLLVLKRGILHKLSKVKNYRLNTTVTINHEVVSSHISGKQPNMMKIVQKIHHGSKQLITTVVFDGQYQWVESKLSNKIQILKIRSSEIVSQETPFDTGYYIMGTGIINGEGYPSTVRTLLLLYNLAADCTSDKIILSGHIAARKFEEYAEKRKFAKLNKQYKERFMKDFGFASITFSYHDLQIQDYALGPSPGNYTIKVKFSKIKINMDVSENEFKYQIPGDVKPTDITEELKQELSGG